MFASPLLEWEAERAHTDAIRLNISIRREDRLHYLMHSFIRKDGGRQILMRLILPGKMIQITFIATHGHFWESVFEWLLCLRPHQRSRGQFTQRIEIYTWIQYWSDSEMELDWQLDLFPPPSQQTVWRSLGSLNWQTNSGKDCKHLNL